MAALLTIGDVVVVFQSVQTLASNGSLEGAQLGAFHVLAAGVRAVCLAYSDSCA